MSGPLVVVALPQEAAHIVGTDIVLTGIGKVAAAMAVTRAIVEQRPTSVLNVGTAGALHDGMEGVHVIGRVIEHDVDHAGLGALIHQELVGEIVLDPEAVTTLATGDAFVSDAAQRMSIARRAHLVDMEGFAVARACQQFDVPCRMVKVVSDTASEDAAATWQEQADRTAREIAAVVAEQL